MKRTYSPAILLSIALVLLAVSCSKDDDDDNKSDASKNKVEVKDMYYVKYEVDAENTYSGDVLEVSLSYTTDGQLNKISNSNYYYSNYNTSKSTMELSKEKQSWSNTYGPFEKKFEASLNVTLKYKKSSWESKYDWNTRKTIEGASKYAIVKARLLVSKNSEPFTVKSEWDKSSNSAIESKGLYYTIDY